MHEGGRVDGDRREEVPASGVTGSQRRGFWAVPVAGRILSAAITPTVALALLELFTSHPAINPTVAADLQTQQCDTGHKACMWSGGHMQFSTER